MSLRDMFSPAGRQPGESTPDWLRRLGRRVPNQRDLAYGTAALADEVAALERRVAALERALAERDR